MLSNAYAENIRCLYENDELMVVHQVTNAANATRDAILYTFTKKDGMLAKLETEAAPLPSKKIETMCLKEKSLLVFSSPLSVKNICAQFLWTTWSLYGSNYFALI